MKIADYRASISRVSPTRFVDKENGVSLMYAHPHGWRFLAYYHETDSVSEVGPTYPTKAELLADLHRYATEMWGFS